MKKLVLKTFSQIRKYLNLFKYQNLYINNLSGFILF